MTYTRGRSNLHKLLRMSLRTALLVALAILSVKARADAILGSGSWQPFPAVLNEDGKPYWDNRSQDGPQMNVGYFLSGLGGSFSEPSPGITPPYWGFADGKADLNFLFQRNTPGTTALLVIEVAGLQNTNEFGWYDPADPLTLYPIFTGPDSAGATVAYIPSNTYGFYLKSAYGTFYTQSSLNSSKEKKHQHFAVFAENLTPGNEIYWIGVEDLPFKKTGKEGYGDFNDMVIRIAPVPEPATAGMMIAGFVLLWGYYRRRQRNSARRI